jgi:hypothetical protein
MAAAQSTEAFRDAFRAQIPPGYSGIRHGGSMLAFGLTVIAAALSGLSMPVSVWELAILVPVIVGWNFLEWHGHRALHRPGTGALARALYQRHTLTHHRFFTDTHGQLRDSRDLRIVFFPVYALPLLTLLSLPPLLAVGFAFSRNAALIGLAGVVGIYLLFELMHLCAHLPDGAWPTRLAGVRAMRRHHLAHHDPQRMMASNMNFTFPLADWIRGTWSRGPQGGAAPGASRGGRPLP